MANTTKEHILDAATRLIHLRGFHNTSIDDILRESGVGKGNFYYYFKSKDELGFATVERAAAQIREQLIARSFAPGRDPWEQLEAFLELVVSLAHQTRCQGGCPLGNLAIEMSDIHEEFRCRLHRAFEEVRGHIEAALRQARAEGSLQPETDVPRLAHFILAAFEGAFMLGKLHKDPGVMAGVIQELKESLARYRVAGVATRHHT
ncbi:MAG: TetR/AcrR family transcriptional regulator [Candidatus Methylomirabilales bacterium]